MAVSCSGDLETEGGAVYEACWTAVTISDEASLKDSATKLARFHDGEKKPGLSGP